MAFRYGHVGDKVSAHCRGASTFLIHGSARVYSSEAGARLADADLWPAIGQSLWAC